MINHQHTIDLLVSSLDMVRDNLEEPDWLRAFARAANAESVICVRWLDTQPDVTATVSVGPWSAIPTGWQNWADHIVDLYAPAVPVTLDAILRELGRPELAEANPLPDPQVLIGVVDWSPSNMFLMAHRDVSLGKWTDAEREHFHYLLELSRRSICLHKEFHRAKYLGSSAMDLLNNTQNGVLALNIDGVIRFANGAAQAILAANDGIQSRDGRFAVRDEGEQHAIQEFLTSASKLEYQQIKSGAAVPALNLAISRPSGRMAYQMLINLAPVAGWRLEATDSDRMALITLVDPLVRDRPSAAALRSYFKLTHAQARLAEQLYARNNLGKAAAVLGISQNTARSHLRAIYAKIGVNTQSELFSLLTATLKPPADSDNPPEP